MISRTYGDIKGEIARVCGASGMSVTDPRVIQRTNDAIEELMNEGQWVGVVDRWHVVATSGQIVLPAQFDMVMQISIAGVPQTMTSPWIEFVAYGPGDVEHPNYWNVNWCGIEGIFERGEVCTKTPLPEMTSGSCGVAAPQGPWYLRVYASVPEEPGIYATVQGLEWGTNQIVRTQVSNGSSAGDWVTGERIAISNGSSVMQSVTGFSEVTAVTKPATNGYVRLTAWNGLEEIELSNYEPGETTPSYHKYYSPWLDRIQTLNPCCRIVRARCRRRFQPVVEDTDVLLISNLGALKCMVQAQWKRDANNYQEYGALKATAIDLMRKESFVYRPKSRVPAISFGKGYAIGSMPSVR